MIKILVLNGPNLDMLGVREVEVYGHFTLHDLERKVQAYGEKRKVIVECFQSNSEGELIDKIHAAPGVYDGIVYNPGAHTHYSYALRDAIACVELPCVEVHISDIDKREDFRHVSVIAPVCVAQVKGRAVQGYCDAIDILLSGAQKRLGENFDAGGAHKEVIIAESANFLDADTCAQGNISSEAVKLPSNDEVAQPQASTRRLKRLRDVCAQDGMDAFFVRDTSNIAYLSAFDDVFDSEAAHALLVCEQGADLHTDSRYYEAAQAAAQLDKTIHVDATVESHAAFALRTLALPPTCAHASSSPSGVSVCLGIEDSMSVSEFRALESACSAAPYKVSLRETSQVVSALRAVKDTTEIARLKAAQAITDAAFCHILKFIRPGLTEREVQLELEGFMRRVGASGLAFSSIVATGDAAANPHAIVSNRRLEAGECVVLDFGARAFGYCSDMTRTVFLGQPDAETRAAYEAIKEANEQVEALLKPGVTGAFAHKFANRVLAEHGFADRMGHGLGHGVGIDIHEEPVLALRNDKPLEVGNVVTVEPGIYIPGKFGMRLEDCGVIVEGGFEVFTRSTHDMIVL